MPTVCIIGAGELGASVAHALANGHGVARVVIIDAAANVAAGKALDIQQSGAIAGFHTQLAGTADPARALGAIACVIADRASPAGEWQGDEGAAMVTRLAPYLGSAPVVFAGASHAGLIAAAAREAGIARERLIGSAPEAFASAVRAIVAIEARCSPAEVMLTVLGAPPAGLVVPWSEASIGGYALERVLTHVALTRLEARVSRLWPPGPYALGLAAARVAEAVTRSSRRAFSVLTVMDGEFGARGGVGSLPVLLSTPGIVVRRVPTLNSRERVQVESALAVSARPA